MRLLGGPLRGLAFPSYSDPTQFPGGSANTVDPAPFAGQVIYDANTGRQLQWHAASGLWLTMNGQGILDIKQFMNSVTITASATVWTDVRQFEIPAGLPIFVDVDTSIGVSQGTLAQLAVCQLFMRLVDDNATSTSFTTKWGDSVVWSKQWASTSGGSLGDSLRWRRYIPAQATRQSAKLQARVTANAGTTSVYNQNNDQTDAGTLITSVAF